MSYRLALRRHEDHKLIQKWDTTDGHLMAASDADVLLMEVRRTMPSVRLPGAATYLVTEEIPRTPLAELKPGCTFVHDGRTYRYWRTLRMDNSSQSVLIVSRREVDGSWSAEAVGLQFRADHTLLVVGGAP